MGLTKEDAEQALISKFEKEQVIEKKRADAQFMKLWRMERDEIHAKGVAARRAEKARIKQLKELQKNINIIPDEMFQPIPDPEAIWKATDPTWLAQQEAKKQGKKPRLEAGPDDEEDVDFVLNQPPKTSWMEDDFLAFEDSEDDNAGEGNSRNAGACGGAFGACGGAFGACGA